MCRDASPRVQDDDKILAKLSDHVPQFVTLPTPYAPCSTHTRATPPTSQYIYKWVEGTSVFNYATSAKVW